MELTVSSKVEALLEQEMKSGRFSDPDQLLETALLALKEREQQRAHFEAMIQEGLDDIERGDVFTEEEARAYLSAARSNL